MGRPPAAELTAGTDAPPAPRPPWAGWAWLLGGASAALFLAYRFWGDASVLGECLTLWPSGVWALVLLPRALWLVGRGRRLAGGLAIASICAFVAGTTELSSLARRAAPPPPTATGLPLRVVTWNVAGGAPFAEAERLRPQILFLQESGNGPAPRGPLADLQWESTLDPATLSAYPMHRLPSRHVGPWTDPQLLLADLPGNRRVLLVNVRLMLPALVTAAARGDGRGVATAHEERIGQYRALAALVRETMEAQGTRSVVLAGDFNCPGGARSLEPLRAVLRDAWSEAGRGWGGTMPALLPVSRIDQVWVSSDIGVRSARVAPRGSSDHRALVVDLVVP